MAGRCNCHWSEILQDTGELRRCQVIVADFCNSAVFPSIARARVKLRMCACAFVRVHRKQCVVKSERQTLKSCDFLCNLKV